MDTRLACRTALTFGLIGVGAAYLPRCTDLPCVERCKDMQQVGEPTLTSGAGTIVVAVPPFGAFQA